MQYGDTMKIEMIGYNDEKAISIYSTIKLMPFILASLILALILLIPALIFEIYYLLIVFIMPGLLLLCLTFNWIVNLNYKGFLKGQRVKHSFCLENGKLFKDGKEVKNTDYIKIYKYKKFLFLELKKSCYRINDNDYISGSREEFLSQVKFIRGHHVYFTLPKISEEEIIKLLLSEVDLKDAQRAYLSPDKKRLIYIYRKDNGIYSIKREKMEIRDKEDLYARNYGWWEPDDFGYMQSFYETIETALNDIKSEIDGYTEICLTNK